MNASPVQLVTGFKCLILPGRREADILPSAESVSLVRGRRAMAQEDQCGVCSARFPTRFVVCGRNALLREFERVMQRLLPKFQWKTWELVRLASLSGMPGVRRRLSVVLGVAHLLHPGHRLPVQVFLYGDVGH